MKNKQINPFNKSNGCSHKWDLINNYFICVCCDKKVKK